MRRHPRSPAGPSVAAAVLLAVLAVGCTGPRPPSGNGSSLRPTRSAPSTQPTGGGGAALGTVRKEVASGKCVAGSECVGFSVDCPGLRRPGQGTLVIARPVGQARGLIMFFSGGGGGQLWQYEAGNDLKLSGQSASSTIDQEAAALAGRFLAGLRADGFVTVQVEWHPAWLAATQGERVGPARLACRPASVIRWTYDTLYRPLSIQPRALACGFCLTGNSAGSSAIAYALAFYGLGSVVDAVVLTGGPPHASITKGCLQDRGFAYPHGATGVFDSSYGFLGSNGPCRTADPTWTGRWDRDSVDMGGTSYDYPGTRVLVLLGAQDPSGVQSHGEAYVQRLERAKSPQVKELISPNLTHAITASAEALQQLKDWLLAS